MSPGLVALAALVGAGLGTIVSIWLVLWKLGAQVSARGFGGALQDLAEAGGARRLEPPPGAHGSDPKVPCDSCLAQGPLAAELCRVVSGCEVCEPLGPPWTKCDSCLEGAAHALADELARRNPGLIAESKRRIVEQAKREEAP